MFITRQKFFTLIPLFSFLFFFLPIFPVDAQEECRCYVYGSFDREEATCNSRCPSICGAISDRSLENWNIDLRLSPECRAADGQWQCNCYISQALRGVSTEEACSDICYALTVPNAELTGEFRDFGVAEEAAPKTEEEEFPTYKIKSPIGEVTGPELIGRIIKTVLGVVGALALAMFVYGGFTWLTSAGSADKIKKGKDILIWATIGLIVIFTSYTLVDFVLRAFGL
ncbi:hypothetical protein HZB93_04205 [Candidatus Falkowbacteria bacterium]|nr:hypothetical protein [Candidatus Falkowbacteria bacterium]